MLIGFARSLVLSTFPSPTALLLRVCQVLSPLQYCPVVPAVIVSSFHDNALVSPVTSVIACTCPTSLFHPRAEVSPVTSVIVIVAQTVSKSPTQFFFKNIPIDHPAGTPSPSSPFAHIPRPPIYTTSTACTFIFTASHSRACISILSMACISIILCIAVSYRLFDCKSCF